MGRHDGTSRGGAPRRHRRAGSTFVRRTLATGPFSVERADIPVVDVSRARRALIVVLATFVAFSAASTSRGRPSAARLSCSSCVARPPRRCSPASTEGFSFSSRRCSSSSAPSRERAPGSPFGAVDGGPWEVPTIVALSNLVSNVPLVLLAAPHTHGDAAWFLLGLASTTAGNLTLVGSAANLIVAEKSGLRFRDHFVPGVLVTLATTALGWWWLA
jgi:hypothetical protein